MSNFSNLASHELEDIDPETSVTNPTYSRMTSKIKSLTSKIKQRQLSLLEIDESLKPEKIKKSF